MESSKDKKQGDLFDEQSKILSSAADKAKEQDAIAKQAYEDSQSLYTKVQEIYDSGNTLLKDAQNRNLTDIRDKAQKTIDRLNQSIKDNYGANAAEFLRKQQTAGAQQGAVYGAGAGQTAGIEAQRSARSAGVNKSLAAQMGAGAAGNAANAAYLQSAMAGQDAYRQSAGAMVSADYTAGENDYSKAMEMANAELSMLAGNLNRDYATALNAYQNKYKEGFDFANLAAANRGQGTAASAGAQNILSNTMSPFEYTLAGANAGANFASAFLNK